MTQTKIVDRIRKLLKLAESSNVDEAANAAAHAQRLMERHNIDVALLDDGAGKDRWAVSDHPDMPLATGKRIATWKVRLCQDLAEVNGCEAYFNADEGGAMDLCLVGAREDALNVQRLYTYLTTEIDRLAVCFRAALPKRAKVRTALESFRVGAVDTIHWRLKEAQEAARKAARKAARAESSTALARIDTAIARLDSRAAEARSFYENVLNPEPAADREETRDWGAYQAGVVAGSQLDLDQRGKLSESRT